MYPIKYVLLYVFMKLTTRTTNAAFIGYYEFYNGLQTTVQFRVSVKNGNRNDRIRKRPKPEIPA
jgi:hypothetical protein